MKYLLNWRRRRAAELDSAILAKLSFNEWTFSTDLTYAVFGPKAAWKLGTIYPALYRLERDGLIESRWQEGQVGRLGDRPRRKQYRRVETGERDPLSIKLAKSATVSAPGVAPSGGLPLPEMLRLRDWFDQRRKPC